MTAARAIFAARLALLWERAAPVLAAPLAALAFYSALALTGAFAWLGDPGRLIAALCLLAAAGLHASRRMRRFSWPSRADAERRVEADSGLIGRPFEALADRPASGSGEMWTRHAERMRQALSSARARRPRAAWAQLDPAGLRIGAVMVLAVAWLHAGDLAAIRLEQAFGPRPIAGGGAQAALDWWIEPPAYTNRATIFLRERDAVEVPAGSVLAGRLAGVNGRPRIDGADASTEEIDARVYSLEARLEQSGEIRVRAGAFARRLSVTVLPDSPPELSLVAEPESDADGRLTLEFRAQDDYGVEQFALELRPDPAAAPDAAGTDWRRLDVPASGVSRSGESGTVRVEVGRDRLAGEPVEIRLAGTDAAGQTGVTAPLALVLPERVFLDGLARAVADERRRFLRGGESYADTPASEPAVHPLGDPPFLDDQPERRIERAPRSVRRLASALDAVSDAPSAWFDDPVVYLGLRTALFETRRAREFEDLSHLEADLWNIALRAELGSLADARAALEAARDALFDALARGADAFELGPLFDAYERAMDNYVAALARESILSGDPAQAGGAGGPDMGEDQLQALLDALREAAELGDTEGAREALRQLQALLENLQVRFAGGAGGGGEEDRLSEALREALEELGDILGEQRSLLDDTFQRGRQDGGEDGEGQGQGGRGEPGGAPPGDQGEGMGGLDSFAEDGQGAGGGRPAPDLADRQAAIGQALDALEEAIGDSLAEDGAGAAAREAIEQAREAMGRAEADLREGRNAAALDRQGEALSALREAGEAAADRIEELARQNGQGQGQDPLGRGEQGAGGRGALDGPSGVVPDEADRQRARDILEELRRRAAEQGRPQEELDYIDRLLERF